VSLWHPQRAVAKKEFEEHKTDPNAHPNTVTVMVEAMVHG